MFKFLRIGITFRGMPGCRCPDAVPAGRHAPTDQPPVGTVRATEQMLFHYFSVNYISVGVRNQDLATEALLEGIPVTVPQRHLSAAQKATPLAHFVPLSGTCAIMSLIRETIHLLLMWSLYWHLSSMYCTWCISVTLTTSSI